MCFIKTMERACFIINKVSKSISSQHLHVNILTIGMTQILHDNFLLSY